MDHSPGPTRVHPAQLGYTNVTYIDIYAENYRII